MKATMHFVAPGTSILEKLHSLVKYFGTNFELKLLLFPEVVLALDPESLDFEYILLTCDEFDEPKRFPTMAVAVETRLDVLFLDESSAENT